MVSEKRRRLTEISAAPTDAGEYSVKAYAEESDDYEAGYSKRVEFTISKAQNEWTVNPAINNWTSDQTPSKPVGEAKFGTVSLATAINKMELIQKPSRLHLAAGI